MKSNDILNGDDAVVFVIDDDASLREAVGDLLSSVGHQVELFASVGEFLSSDRPESPCCLVLDVRLPGVSGLDFQNQLASADRHIPVIMMTGHGDVPMTVRAMKAGAIDFLTKPFRDQDMLDAVAQALEHSRQQHEKDREFAGLQARYDSLTAREREVMALVTAGLMNKQVAAQIGLSEVTVKVHRGRVMQKMGVRTLADLVRVAELVAPRASADGHP